MEVNYSPTYLVEFVHGFPHLSFRFIYLKDPLFTFEDEQYLESLLIIALVPVAVLLISLIAMFIYYCCIKIKPEKQYEVDKSCYCSLCLFIVFAMLTLAGIGMVAYGTNQMHEGISSSEKTTKRINQSFSIVNEELINIDQILLNFEINVRDLDDTSANNSLVATLRLSINLLKITVVKLPYQTIGANDRLDWFIKFLNVVEKYRTIITYCLIGFYGNVCVVALLGICFRSRMLLVITIFFGLLCLVASYLYTGVAVMVNVGLADLCVKPFQYIKNQTVSNYYIDKQAAEFYLDCPADLINPFDNIIKNVSFELDQIDKILLDFEESNIENRLHLILDDLLDNFLSLEKSIQTLSNSLDCGIVNTALKKLVHSVCFSTFDGLFILCIAMLSVCITLTVILCAAPHTWRRFSEKAVTEELDLDDVFHPPAARQPSISRTNNPLYISPEERYVHHVRSNTTTPAATNTLSFFRRSEEDVTLLDPPPEYSPPRSSDY